MKKILHCFVAAVFILLIPNTAGAQGTVSIGTGTSNSTSYPIYTFYNYSATECIYLGSEMSSNTGMITKVAYEKVSGASTTAPAIKIYMKATTQTGVNSGSSSSYAIGTSGFGDYTLVYDGTLPNSSTSGWMEVTLNTPFYYGSTTQNLSVLVTGSTYISSGRPAYRITSTGSPYKRSAYNSDSSAWSSSATMSSGTDRPNIRLTFQAAAACSGTPAPGNTVSTSSSVCPGNAFTLSLQNATTGTGVSYQWQSSTTGTSGWTNISGATSSTLQTTQTAATYYRCNVTCSGSTGTSNPLGVTMSNTIPFFEGFESGQTSAATVAGCWSQQSISGSQTWMANSTETSYNRTPRTGSWNAYLQYSNEDWLFYPLQLTGGNTYQMEFYARQDITSGATITAAYGTSASAASMTNTIVAGTAVTSGNYQKLSGTFTPTASGTYYIGIKATLTSAPYYVSIDDIKVDVLPNCNTSAFPSSITASASKTAICSSEPVTFSIGTGIPEATGITYQWKSSPDGTTFVNAGAASASSVATLTANSNARWFKCDVLCNGTVMLTSTPVEISLNVSLTGTTPGTRCGSGAVQLSATTQPGNTVKWYTAETNGTLIGTGTTIATPVIAHTTTYYAAATGTLNNYNAGASTPQSLATSYGGTTNEGVAMKFNLSTAITLASVTIYPRDTQSNNIIYLKDTSGNILKQLTFSTVGTSPLSTSSTLGAAYIVTLNWEIPAGNDYRLEWGIPTDYGSNLLVRTSTNASSLYSVNNNGLTFTGNTSAYGNNYWFYFYDWKFTTGCGESATRVPVTATVNYEWTGGADNNWHNPSNWCGGTIPGIEDNVTIGGNNTVVEIQQNTIGYANSLTLGDKAGLTIAGGGTVWIANGLTIGSDATLTVEDNGALVQVNNAANSGKIVVSKKSKPLYRLDYTIWSSPVAGQNLLDFSPATSDTRFYTYNPASDAYARVTSPSTTSFDGATGYLIRMPNVFPSLAGYIDGTAAMQFTGNFAGAPHNGTITKTLTPGLTGFNAVGNPYPSPINLADFFAANSGVIDGSGIYFWRKKNNGLNSSYATLTLAAFTANPAEGGGSENNPFYVYDAWTGSNNWLIAPGQGFLVKTAATSGNPVLTFTNAMRRPTPGSTQSFFRTGADTASRLWVNLTTAQGGASQAAVAYMDNATMGIDYGYDGAKCAEANTLTFYSLADTTPLTIQARPAFVNTDVVPMGYFAPTAGTHTISLDHTDGVFTQGQTIYLRDNAEGIVRSLNAGSYTFATEAGAFETRFELLYSTEALGTDVPVIDANNVVVVKQGSTITVNSGSVLMNGITIYDTRGRKVYSVSDINNTQTAINNLTAEQQVLIIEINTVKGKVSKRIVF